MEITDAVSALRALAQEHRVDVFRLLVRTGPDGLPAGEIAELLKIAPATLSFHLAQLRQAGLATMRREGRSLIYSADYDGMKDLMGFLTENCCAGAGNCQNPVSDADSVSVRRAKPKRPARQ